MKTLILASQSPRRRELLEKCGVPFLCEPADLDETIDLTKPLADEIEKLACRKAEFILAKHPDAVVLGSDTTVSIDGKSLGKPKNREDAFHMLKELEGRTHEVITGVAVISSEKKFHTRAISRVTFVPMDDEEICRYINTGECMDKAGAYAIQGIGGRYVSRIEGDYYTIMGLPLSLVYAEMKNLSSY